MYSVGCLTRTMYFLDICMDALAYILLAFGLIKLLIVIFFYSLLCVYTRYRKKHPENNHHLMSDSPPPWRHSSSFDSSSTENIPKKILLSPPITKQNVNDNHDHQYIEKRRVILNEYDSQTPNKRVQNAPTILSLPLNNNLSTSTDEQQNILRKLSYISEKTEKTETDDSDPDILRIRQYDSKRKAIITAVSQKRQPPPLPTKLPTIKNRRNIVRDDENDNDSGTLFFSL